MNIILSVLYSFVVHSWLIDFSIRLHRYHLFVPKKNISLVLLYVSMFLFFMFFLSFWSLLYDYLNYSFSSHFCRKILRSKYFFFCEVCFCKTRKAYDMLFFCLSILLETKIWSIFVSPV